MNVYRKRPPNGDKIFLNKMNDMEEAIETPCFCLICRQNRVKNIEKVKK